jgi:GTPase
MEFIDEATIEVSAGNGGHGCLSFRRERYVARGGPDGANGGKGGDIYLRASASLNTLYSFRFTKRFRAESGLSGQGKDCHGRNGQDLIIDVPVGTCIYLDSPRTLIEDLSELGQSIRIAEGGSGGLGNTHFKSSVQRAPRKTTRGTEGEDLRLFFELKVLADVGLLGFPNAGKSTLMGCLSAARPKIANYPFTTIKPQLGVVVIDYSRSVVMADIPGLIEGASRGTGLGIRFLKHIARCRFLLHLIDGSQSVDAIVASYKTLRKELIQYGEEVSQKPERIVITKRDLFDGDHVKAIKDALGQEIRVVAIMQKEDAKLFKHWLWDQCRTEGM